MKLAALGVVVAIGIGTLFGAPSPAVADDEAAARFHDQRAREFYARGRYEEAAREFFLEQRIAPNPRIVFNIALCLRLLGQHAEAFQMFAEYLASDDEDAERRTEAEAALLDLSPRVTRINVNSDPAGARIYINREELGAYGNAPTVIAVEPGEHQILARMEGHESAELTVQAVRGSELNVNLTLPVITGELVVEAPENSTVRVRDGSGRVASSGAAPLRSELPPGSYEVTVSSEGHAPYRRLVTVRANETGVDRATLAQLPEPVGSLTVTANQVGALVEVDGEPAGFTPLVLEGTSVGSHRIAVRLSEMDPWVDELHVSEEEPTWVTVTLQPSTPENTHSALTWVLGGTGIAALAAGTVFGAFALDNHSQFSEESDPILASELVDRGRTLNIFADVLFLVGALTLGTGIALFVSEESEEHEPSSASIAQERPRSGE